MVRPMHQAAFRVPDIFTIEGYAVSLAQPLESRRQIDIVRNQNCLSRRKTDNKSLVPTSFNVIR